MQTSAKAMTNIALIRDFQQREHREHREVVAPPPAVQSTHDTLPFLFRDRTQRLIECWNAPVLSEEEIETWAKLYQLCPKSGMSFVEYLIARGVGSIG